MKNGAHYYMLSHFYIRLYKNEENLVHLDGTYLMNSINQILMLQFNLFKIIWMKWIRLE